MDNFIQQFQALFSVIQLNLPISLSLIGILWIVQIVNVLLGYRLNYLGIYPRHLLGMPGIAFSPFLHGSFNHLFFNSIPLFILINFMLLAGWPLFVQASILIILISGSAIWLFGRPAIHVGASSVVMGYWGYLLIGAYYNPSALSIVLGILCLYYLGGLFFSIFPSEESVSWEGHLFGLLAGFAAFAMINHSGLFTI